MIGSYNLGEASLPYICEYEAREIVDCFRAFSKALTSVHCGSNLGVLPSFLDRNFDFLRLYWRAQILRLDVDFDFRPFTAALTNDDFYVD